MKKLKKILIALAVLLLAAIGYIAARAYVVYDPVLLAEEPQYLQMIVDADLGHVGAQGTLAMLYRLRMFLGQPNSPEGKKCRQRSLYWYRRALKNGHSLAAEQIEKMTEEEKDYEAWESEPENRRRCG